MAVIMRDAIKPNLLQTLENTPVLVHAGPFGNIAHGNSSVVADLIGIHTGDFLITEAGFGADMGAERFFNIKCRASGLTPDAAVVVATVRALKAHSGKHKIVAGKPLPDGAARARTRTRCTSGGANLRKQIENIRLHGVSPVVAINAFPERLRVRARGDPRDRRGDGRRGPRCARTSPTAAGARPSWPRRSPRPPSEPSRLPASSTPTRRACGRRSRRSRPRSTAPTASTTRPLAARQLDDLRAQRASATCRSASPRRTCRSRRTRRSRARRPAGGCRCARCAPRSAPGSSTRSAATCAPCQGSAAARGHADRHRRERRDRRPVMTMLPRGDDPLRRRGGAAQGGRYAPAPPGGMAAARDLTVGEFLDALAARAPAPAAGACAAITAAAAAALAAKAARFSPGELSELAADADRLRAEVTALADADGAAYGAVLAAVRLPRNHLDRQERLASAVAAATEIPLRIARIGAEVATLAGRLEREGNPNLRGDAQAAALLADGATPGRRGARAHQPRARERRTMSARLIDGRRYAAELRTALTAEVRELAGQGYGRDWPPCWPATATPPTPTSAGCAGWPNTWASTTRGNCCPGTWPRRTRSPRSASWTPTRGCPASSSCGRCRRRCPRPRCTGRSTRSRTSRRCTRSTRGCSRWAARASSRPPRRRRSTWWTATSSNPGAIPATVYERSNVVVVGRSANVGKPAIALGMERGATVVSCDVHSYSLRPALPAHQGGRHPHRGHRGAGPGVRRARQGRRDRR